MKKVLFAAIPLVMLAGCSTFDANYSKLAAEKSNAPVEGAWIGRWQSEKGHGGGELKAVISPDGKTGAIAADKTYIAQFKAQWAIFSTEYSTPITTHAELKNPNEASVKSEADVGMMLGKYVMEGTSSPTEFKARYKATGDEGTIELKRP